MRALVTGATGFVGAHIAHALHAQGITVRIWRRPGSRLDALAGLAFEDYAGDLFDVDALAAACAGCDWVFHAAAVAQYWRIPVEQIYRVNVEGADHVLRAAREAGAARVVFTSSGAAVGRAPGGWPAGESLPFNLPPARFPYGHSKWLAEERARAAAAAGQHVVIVNPSAVLGPGDLNRVSGDIVIRAAKRQIPMMPAGGFGVIDVRDLAAAHLAAAEHGRSGERYILNVHNIPTREIIRLAAEAAGVRPPSLTTPRALIPPLAALIDLVRALGIRLPMDGNQLRLSAENVYFDASKARDELGLAGRALHETVYDTWRWYKDAGML
ncbi:MAG: NAD-dependent epimerase/dehydratase family protein [Anaerolineae bacterium]|nr:NAD-dependent epimerase/dehydratase family protein [Anaerolineae bacterium]